MALNNRNIQISILEINRKSITIWLNNLPYLSDSGHLKRRDVHVALELLKIENTSLIASAHRNQKYISVKSSITFQWLNGSAGQPLIHLCLDNGMMSYNSFNVEPF